MCSLVGFKFLFESTVAFSLFTQPSCFLSPVFEFIFTGKSSRLFFKKPSGFFFSPLEKISFLFKSAILAGVFLCFEQFAGVGFFVCLFLHDFLIFVKNVKK